MTVQTVDPAKLAAIRDQWKKRSLLLSKDKKSSERARDDARYDSDRNRVVEREQRAARADTIPDPRRGGGGSGQSGSSERSQQKRNIPLSKLGALSGITQSQARMPADSAPGPQGMGVDQALLDDQLPIGAENMLNTRESVYYTFYARIYQQIGPIWRSKVRTQTMGTRVPPGRYSTLVEVILDEEGNYVDTRYIQNSGIPEFDRLIVDSWNTIPRFPNPPRDLIGKDGYVRMGWSFVVSVDEGSGWNVGNPSRAY